ncbi:FecR family protein [Luteolibacter arcticus]|uniref:FecR family protein n=1 Tax=Luteolibacter arcticus TaxID=1581411 RepID=A0ABT3GKP5_9BACT|nr:FecR family protein [Luteolibacter arcticus]MCW1924065.1 FecR family protein [Luteolibacter arcticus]
MKARLSFAATTAITLLALTGPLLASPLSEAQITYIVKDVRTVDPQKAPRPAKLREKLNTEQSVRTGIASRTELLFNDNTLTRIGANSHFSFTEGTRNMELKNGVILLQVPKGAGGAEIRTAAVTAAVTGTTIMLEASPGFTKLIVLEGSAWITPHGDKRKRKTNVKAGQEVILPNEAQKAPAPVVINLDVLVKTSKLASGKWGVALDKVLIDQAIAQQSRKGFVPTNLAIVGPGSNVVQLPEAGRLPPPPIVRTNPNGQPPGNPTDNPGNPGTGGP